MQVANNLTKGSVFGNIIRFSLPYLLSYFLQTLYGLADLFITGQFNGADTITAVSVGSQIMHMLTVIIVGLAMGSTVTIGRYIGGSDFKKASKTIGNTIIFFGLLSLVLMAVLLLGADGIVRLLSTPGESVAETKKYLIICFAGIPFIVAYNIISSVFRGLGDSKSPMYFIGVACVINILIDYIFIGLFNMGAAGAAFGTVISQFFSVIFALITIKCKKIEFGVTNKDLKPDMQVMSEILKIGVPVAVQDGLIQVSFIIITIIANNRGVNIAAAVGIVEKIISFLFLVPSSMLSSISAIAAQNVGAGLHGRAKQTLMYGVFIASGVGLFFAAVFQFIATPVMGMFTDEEQVIIMGSQYLKAYVLDCFVAGIHFCFSGYFCAYGRSMISFIHNFISILVVRVPGAYLASQYYPDTLYPMGLAAPAGSLLSAIICIVAFLVITKKMNIKSKEKNLVKGSNI